MQAVLFCDFITEFEELAATSSKTERHISPGEAQFLFSLVKEHGDNYKVIYYYVSLIKMYNLCLYIITYFLNKAPLISAESFLSYG